ncbi:AraC family transcriptional regulator [Nocardia cyriacigeorgica]|uniref:AraC family transcriptional regulator n=1 Tax=Nocardia cyriacigeorgica TaxID=135487 RepID=A0ABX0CRM3_9NOCA|nr:AraC family transcriptional regulator [Nocardia cyriacigeorgica]NEW59153.1 AraC family transcriptional regulator [Nocardia cyriacigeorgica]
MVSEAAVEEATTTQVDDPRDRIDYWSQLVDSFQGKLTYRFPSERDFYGHMIRRRTSDYQIVGWHSDPIVYLRDSKHIRVDPDEDYRLVVPLTGVFDIRQDGDGIALEPGVGSLVTIDHPLQMGVHGGSHGLIMTIPRREIRHRLNRVEPPARPLDLTVGLGRVAADLASGLYAEATTLSPGQFDAVAERLVDLVCMLILGEAPSGPGHLGHVEESVRRYVRRHAGDPDLSTPAIARALGWSVRQVQLALHQAGTTPREVIREERLQLARIRLTSPAFRQQSITDIAFGLGFGSTSSFSTAFRQRFGATPRSVRTG